ncbi:MAG: prolyl oligopeptidase family serine peptidase [Bacteroidales bacterium]|nr:prolyl oligopeptidase family serine peptidase [Bacteroidales bacterium]
MGAYRKTDRVKHMIGAIVLAMTVFATRPAQEQGGRLLSVEQAAGPETRPALLKFHWDVNGRIAKGKAPDFVYEGGLPSGAEEGIVYGEHVSRNEFNCDRGVIPCPGGRGLVAVYRKDERQVGTFPLVNVGQENRLKEIRYPMAGAPSEKLELCVCDFFGNILSTLKITDFTDERYLTNVSWGPDGKYIFVQVLDREQHHMRLNQYRADNGKFVRTILTEENDAWVEPLDPIHFVKGSYKFIYRTDNRDSFRSLYLCDTLGNIRRITQCNADVEYCGNDGRFVYYTSHEISPVQCQLMRVKIGSRKSGTPQRLTTEPGWHVIQMSQDCTRFIDTYSSLDNPGTVKFKTADGKLVRVLDQAKNPLAGFAQCEVETGTVKSADGRYDNWYRLVKPLNFDPDRKYPLIHYVYGGPHSQMVTDSWLAQIRMWEMLMAQKGFLVYIQDNRGTMNRGAEYEKAINRQCGRVEMEDQVAGIRELISRGFVDTDRIGVMGWSYGGFMSISLVTGYPEIYKAAAAGGPVIDWKWYEVMYGERYMDTPESNPEGYRATSLMNRTSCLARPLLICQGAVDDTVLWLNSLSFVEKCVEEGIPLDYFPYPVSKHNMSGKARAHLYAKLADWFTDKL